MNEINVEELSQQAAAANDLMTADSAQVKAQGAERRNVILGIIEGTFRGAAFAGSIGADILRRIAGKGIDRLNEPPIKLKPPGT